MIVVVNLDASVVRLIG